MKSLAFLVTFAVAQTDAVLVKVKGRAFAYERMGTITSVTCADAKEEGCEWIERLALQPQVDWDRLEAKLRRSKGTVTEAGVDERGGVWTFAVTSKGQRTVEPGFWGYKLAVSGRDVESAEVVKKEADWNEACAEAGLDPATGRRKKKKGLLRAL